MRFDPIEFVAHVLAYGETPSKTVRDNRALADELDRIGHVVFAVAKRSSRDREQTKVIRRWAKENGYKVSDRGPVSETIVDIYHRSWVG